MQPHDTEEPAGHVPVLLDAVLSRLAVRPGETVVDATVGMGGHARALAAATGSAGTLVGLDVDPDCLASARKRLADLPCRLKWIHANFASLAKALESVGLKKVDVIFADLGVSSTQLEDSARGLSFQHDGPLDMRLDPRLDVTAADLVNRLKDKALGDLLYHNAQEHSARRIARRICAVRREGRITTTRQLAAIVARAAKVDPASRRSRIHPATRTFQALRMAVNDEVNSLKALLDAAPGLLNPGGRIGIIAFHSGEDRPVKTDFVTRKRMGLYEILTRKPVVAQADERRANPRSRSAKLRVARRLGDNDSDAR
ncbi:MAG: 16S rRNA (cytosine(1402)-N(4))-methyltransferase RsmH [Phycisphaerae bacterium]